MIQQRGCHMSWSAYIHVNSLGTDINYEHIHIGSSKERLYFVAHVDRHVAKSKQLNTIL